MQRRTAHGPHCSNNHGHPTTPARLSTDGHLCWLKAPTGQFVTSLYLELGCLLRQSWWFHGRRAFFGYIPLSSWVRMRNKVEKKAKNKVSD